MNRQLIFSFFLILVFLNGMQQTAQGEAEDSLFFEDVVATEFIETSDSNSLSNAVYPPSHYEEGRHLDSSLWKELTKELQYDDTVAVKKSKRSVNLSPNLNINTTFLQYILYLLAIGVIVFIIYKLIGNMGSFDSKVNKNTTSFENIEDDEVLIKKELDALLEKALANEDYRSAIRIRFIQSLQVLETKKYIHWKKEKTNRDYLSELTSNAAYIDFSNMVILYEKAWYGSYTINKTDYDSFHLLYQQVIEH